MKPKRQLTILFAVSVAVPLLACIPSSVVYLFSEDFTAYLENAAKVAEAQDGGEMGVTWRRIATDYAAMQKRSKMATGLLSGYLVCGVLALGLRSALTAHDRRRQSPSTASFLLYLCNAYLDTVCVTLVAGLAIYFTLSYLITTCSS